MEKIIKTGFVFLLLFGAWYFGHTTSDKNPMNELMLENIEALANNENDQHGENYRCYGRGEVDCDGEKFEIRFSGFSLD